MRSVEHLNSIFEDKPETLLRSEAAAILRCRDQHVSELYHRGELAGFQRAARQGSKLLIYRDALREYMERYTR